MSLEPEDMHRRSTKKQKAEDTSNNDDEGRIYLLTIMTLPVPIRVSVFNCLDQESLMESTLVSKQWHKECNGPGIENKIIPVFELSPSDDDRSMTNSRTRNFLQNLCRHQHNNETNIKLQRYRHMRVNNVHEFDWIFSSTELGRIRNNLRRMDGIVSLDMSLLSLAPIYNSLPNALSSFNLLPNLREINLSNTGILSGILHKFFKNCPLLEKITWNNIPCASSSMYMDGFIMRSAKNLKEIIMDDSEFSYPADIVLLLNLEIRRNTFIFHVCSKALERVSIRNAKYLLDGSCYAVPQNALIKFVRNAPSTLRWFRSNLSKENMNMLHLERPEIELLN
jgi:hypothetical protein